MKLSILNILFIATIFAAPSSVHSQSAKHPKWEKVGSVDFSAAAFQSANKVVLTTTHGYLYSTTDKGTTWQRKELNDSLFLQDVAFIDSLHGMVIDGWKNIFITNDGGATWKRTQTPTVFGPNKLSLPSKDTAYLCGLAGNIWRSTDAGESWNQQASATSRDLYSMYFFDARSGIIMGDRGTLLKTTDAGEHWAQVSIIGDNTHSWLAADFFGRDTGIVAGFGHFLTTTNGGKDWKFLTLPDSAYADIRVVKLLNNHDVFAFGPAPQVYLSSDLGEHWNIPLIHEFSASSHTYLASAVFRPDFGALAVGNAGCILQSPTGKNWTVQHQCPTGGGSTYMQFFDGLNVNAIPGKSGFFITSSDGGVFWKGHFTFGGPLTGYIGLHFTSQDSGILETEGQVNSNESTTNRGKTWTENGNAPYSRYNSMSFGTASVGYVVGDSMIKRTIDAGYHWDIIQKIAASSTPSPYPDSRVATLYFRPAFVSVAAVDSEYAYALRRVYDSLFYPKDTIHYIKSHSLLYRTTDVGVSWSEISSAPLLPRANGVYFRDRSLGYLTCDSGVCYRTSNGGATWSRVEGIVTTQALKGVNFLNDSVGFMGGDSGIMYSSRDNGKHWELEPIIAPINGVDRLWGMTFKNIYFPDSNTVFADAAGNGYYTRKLNRNGVESVPQVDNKIFTVNPYLYVQIFPDPNDGIFTCRLSGLYSVTGVPLHVTIIDVLGRTVMDVSSQAKQFNNGATSEFQIDARPLPTGCYRLELQAGPAIETRGFVRLR